MPHRGRADGPAVVPGPRASGTDGAELITVLQARLGLLALHVALPAVRRWPRATVAVALAGFALPFLLPVEKPFARVSLALLTGTILVRMLRYAAGRERPQGLHDFLLFVVVPAVVRWENPRRPDRVRAARCALTALLQLAAAYGLMRLVIGLDFRNPVELFTTQIGIYLVIAAICNLYEVWLSLRGLDYDAPFDNPIASTSPAEFWSRRWNTWVHRMLHDHVFVPCGGRRHPVRGTLAAFAASGLFHVAGVAVGTGSFNVWMLAFFLVQGFLVVATMRSRSFRRLGRTRPRLAAAITVTTILVTGTMLVRGSDGVDPSYAWARCCRDADAGAR